MTRLISTTFRSLKPHNSQSSLKSPAISSPSKSKSNPSPSVVSFESKSQNLINNWFVYLIFSTNPPIKTYVGATNNFSRRLRQHNGELKAGAKASQVGRSWMKDTILVVVDGLYRFKTSMDIAQAFLDNVYKLHGLPKTIVSDRDRLFLSRFWQELFKVMGTQLNFSSGYHPQTDGQTQGVNRCIETYLRVMTGQRPHKWATWLPLVGWWYNTTPHSAINMSPFEALYGLTPRQLNLPNREGTLVAAVGEFFKSRDIMYKILKEALTHAQNRYKLYADKNRTEREFEQGDLAYLKLQHTDKAQLNLEEAQVILQGQFLFQPASILKRKMIRGYNHAVPQILVQWEDSCLEEATWEDAASIHPSIQNSCLQDKTILMDGLSQLQSQSQERAFK